MEARRLEAHGTSVPFSSKPFPIQNKKIKKYISSLNFRRDFHGLFNGISIEFSIFHVVNSVVMLL